MTPKTLMEQHEGYAWTERLRVPGGWLVRIMPWDFAKDQAVAIALVYLPDHQHRWLAAGHLR